MSNHEPFDGDDSVRVASLANGPELGWVYTEEQMALPGSVIVTVPF